MRNYESKKERTVSSRQIIFLKQFILLCFLCGILIAVFCTVSVAAKSRNPKEPTPVHQETGLQKYYTSVKINDGDTLWSIAAAHMPEQYTDSREYVEEIMALNHLQSSEIHSGGYLVVPYYQ